VTQRLSYGLFLKNTQRFAALRRISAYSELCV